MHLGNLLINKTKLLKFANYLLKNMLKQKQNTTVIHSPYCVWNVLTTLQNFTTFMSA